MLAQSELLEEDKYAETRPDGSVQSVAYQKDNGSMDDEQAMEMDKLVTHISEQWTINRNDRVYVEQQMLAMQEAVNGEYDSETLAAINAQGGSSIFIPLTSMQCNAGASWLISVLTPPGDKAWSLKSTPVPELPTSLKDKISANVKATIQKQAAPQEAGGPPGSPPPSGGPQGQPPALPKGPQGQPIGPKEVGKIADMEAEQLHKNFKKESILRAENMEGMIDDQLIASGWYQTLEDFVIDLVTFPTAFIKTTYEYSTKLSTNVVDGQFTMTSEEELIAKDERVSPFDMYPSPDQNTIDDGSLIERLKMSRNEIYKCLDKPGYSNENILKVLEEVDGSGFASWQSSVDSQRRYSENHATDFSGQDGSVYGLRFLGFVSIEKLLDWGYSVETLQEQGLITEPLDEYGEPSQRDKWREIDIDAILVGTHVIKAVPNMDPEGKRPYYMASYRKVPGSFWGKSAAMLATPHQRLVNATARALSNNMGIACLTGDTVVFRNNNNGKEYSEITVAELYEGSGGNRKLRCLDEDEGIFYQNKLITVVNNGEAAVYEMKTKRGYTIKATDNHRFMRSDGKYDFLSNFTIGDDIAVNGQESPRTRRCVDCGCEIGAKANRCKRCHTADWNSRQREAARGNTEVSSTTSRQRKDCLDARKDFCEECGADGVPFEVHHKDVNPHNNSKDNLENLCVSCHHKAHVKIKYKGDPYYNNFLDYDEIISIEYAGQEVVYDLQMEAPDHNFVANGFISHNSGPQIVVYTDRLPNGESLQSIRPLKIWQMTSDPAGSNSKPIDFFQPESNAQELMAVYQYYFDSVGDVTGIPKQSYSSDPTRAQQGAQTASGLAMLLETASKQIKKAVMNIDSGVIEPRLKYQYQINMMNPEVDNRYKGDMHIKAIGAKSIVAKAVENQRSMELLQATANPIDQAVLGEDGRAALLRTIMRNYDMVDIAPTSEEMEARKEQQSKQPSPPSPEETKLKIEEMRSETRLKDQEMESQLATQQQETDLAIANIELQKKEMDMQIAITNNKDNNETKLKNTALKETNENTRFELEANIKANSPSGTGL